jgi:hypothetical protein
MSTTTTFQSSSQKPVPPTASNLKRMQLKFKDKKSNNYLVFEIASVSAENAIAFAKFFYPEFAKFEEIEVKVLQRQLPIPQRQFGICQFVTNINGKDIVHYCLVDKKLNVHLCSKSLQYIYREYRLSCNMIHQVSKTMFMSPLRFVPHIINNKYYIFDTKLNQPLEENFKESANIDKFRGDFITFPDSIKIRCEQLNNELRSKEEKQLVFA